MDKFITEYRKNLKLIDQLLRPINQGFLNPVGPKSVCGWFLYIWPIWYCSCCVCFYTYLILVHGKLAGLKLVSQQLWFTVCAVQLVAKLVNGVVQRGKLLALFKWCEECYTMDYRTEYREVVLMVFERTNLYISSGIRFMSIFVVIGAFAYALQPVLLRVHETPTQVSINGNDQWPLHTFVLIYVAQVTTGVILALGICGYDNVFIQCSMVMSYRFRTMSQLLSLLNYKGPRDARKDRQVLVDVYKMHLSVLDATALFRSYYSFYGLVQLGTCVLVNCLILHILKTIGYDFRSVSVIVCSSFQVLMTSVFGQLLQDESSAFGDALYGTNWLDMSLGNKKRVLMLMTGSRRVVHIRAGGTHELNLFLFAKVMKAGMSLCAVMQAM